jgi:hypothetical protein
MPYVQRNNESSICGLFANPQEGYAEEWLDDDNHEVLAFLNPPVPPVAPHLNNGGLARFSGAAPVSVLEAIRMAGVTRISKGRYRVTHEEAMPSDQYSVGLSVMDANPRTVRYTARTASYVEVRVTDLAGAVQDPAEITVQTQRVVS